MSELQDRFKKAGHTALVLEGGGFRGVYTAGILDRFLEEDIHFPHITGVSMGAINGVNYLTDQYQRTLNWCLRYAPDRKYMGFYNLMREGNFFSHDYGFNRAARRFTPFDFKRYYSAPEKFYYTTTDVTTGKAKYFEKMEDDVILLSQATTAVPMMSKFIKVQGGYYLDGGVSDAVPLVKPQEDGYDRLVYVLTRPKGYRKGVFKNNPIIKWKYRKFPNLLEAFETRNERYNQSMEIIEKLEDEGKAFVFRPNEDVDGSLILRDTEVLRHSYDYGYSQADIRMAEFKEFLNKSGGELT